MQAGSCRDRPLADLELVGLTAECADQILQRNADGSLTCQPELTECLACPQLCGICAPCAAEMLSQAGRTYGQSKNAKSVLYRARTEELLGLDGPSSAAVSPDGRHVYVGSYFASSVAAFDRNPTSGRLLYNRDSSFLSDSVAGNNLMGNVPPRCLDSQDECKDSGYGRPLRGLKQIVMSKEGTHLYGVSDEDSALLIFDRDNDTGALSLTRPPIFDGSIDGGSIVDGLAGASAVLISENGLSVYVAGARDQAVAAFQRDPVTGSLTYIDRIKNGERRFDQFVLEPTFQLSSRRRSILQLDPMKNVSTYPLQLDGLGSVKMTKYFSMDGQQYLAVVKAAAESEVGAALIYRWDTAKNSFKLMQALSENQWAVDIESM